mmetsp:Transcript_10041/g.13266  ORF Transcript_10041/g.13266 Transcript_10041/m.13266 type:complete len:216 (-) Transcript_10041:75-722(-)|eukprot:CAMPEP_0198141180 /NCGR_PEP_ID=MMETSP1443-20131203/4220_1 /TAXON_ID=186043 /ORGANISM="Entomoneis sp., Strain CCMP2396" /LENGTH=215 /DNA_ID=CAMNT_0043803833 /DNA_START=83 /DNA_END=730 /DNA_ORIENTATION=-
MKFLVLALSMVSAASFGVAPQSAVRTSTQLHEGFGLGLGEDTYANQPDFLKGEGEYKEWVNTVNEDNMLNRQYNVIRRVRELNLLKATADNGILSKLEAQGLDLSTIEKVLPVLEDAGLLSIAGNNQQILVNLVAPLLVEGAPFLLPVVAGAIGSGPPAFFLAAAAAGGLEVALLISDVQVPLIGLPAAYIFGLLLVPLAGASAAAGVALGSLKK